MGESKRLTVEQIECIAKHGTCSPHWEAYVGLTIAQEFMVLLKELDYAYRCITSGYRQNVFDFSVLKDRAFEFTRLQDTSSSPHVDKHDDPG